MSSVQFIEHSIENGKRILEIKLNSERTLNALSLEMIEQITPKLDQAREDDNVTAILLDSAGDKAFCAGGDVVTLYNGLKDDEADDFIEKWFVAEYAMDYAIHKFPKPIVCWASGIVMGGGMGMMNGCSHRIVTETTRMAMPEVTIALYPDVGASWFFNRMQQGIGRFLALTASQMNAADALFLGLADRFISTDKREQVLQKLQSADWKGDAHSVVTGVLKAVEADSQKSLVNGSKIKEFYPQIMQVTDYESPVEIVHALNGLQLDDSWLQRAQNNVKHGSPLAVHLIFQQLERSRHCSLREVFLAELVLTANCCRQPELSEGIRALLVDKDRSPKWMYSCVEDVDSEYVESFFQAPWDNNPLAAYLSRVDEVG